MRDAGLEVVLEAGDRARQLPRVVDGDACGEVAGDRPAQRLVAGLDTGLELGPEVLGHLRSYEVHGIEELAPAKIADFLRIRSGGTNDARRRIGSVTAIRDAFVGIQEHLFR
jgi:hypothetical protein